MGKLPGLDRLKKDRSDLLAEQPVAEQSAEQVKAVQAPPPQPVENEIVARPVVEVRREDRKIEVQKNKKVEIKKDKEKTTGVAAVVAAKVSAEFKAAVAVYCVEHDRKEIDLIREVLDDALQTNASAVLGGKRYNTTAGGTDTSKTIYGRYEAAFKKAAVILAKKNSITEGFLVSQAVARKIGWNKVI